VTFGRAAAANWEKHLSEESYLSDDFVRQLISVGDVDLLVAIPTHNDSKTIGGVVRAAEQGLLRNFGRQRAALMNVDSGSRDGTLQAVREASALGATNEVESLRTLRWIKTNCGGAGTGAVLRTILAAADLLHARGCAVISGSAENAAPAWIESLLSPVYRENYDFVAPLYARHKYDGLLTRTLLYPLSRALYGKAVRELRGTEFAFSGRLAAHSLAHAEWNEEGAQAGTEMWMAITAMSNVFRCCQTYLGPKPRSAASAGVVEAIRRTVSGFFWCLQSTENYWLNGAETEAVKTAGPEHELTNEAIRVDRKKLLRMYQTGIAELSEILKAILDPETHGKLVELAGLDEDAFRLSNPLWVRTIYEFAGAYHHAVIHRDHLVQAFVPLYRGKVYSFLTEHRSSDSADMEADVEDLCQEFGRQKALFIERWKTRGEGGS
jgi:glucosylglycerate synthase